jgi:bifunctional DNA-binding transcriptional regulator/antitoxin component of YhaV-PrlF toxin-antitoxin module
MKSYMTTVEKDEDGELLLTFPDELMDAMDWKLGDVLEWIDNEDGTWTIQKLT